MIRFVHTADIHFGMENYGKIDPKTGIHTRLLDFERALSACIDRAIAEEVDLFVFAGDAYKTASPTPTQQKLLLKLFLRLYKANIPTVIVIGNHDHPLSFGKAHSMDLFNDLPLDGFYVLAKPATITITTKSGPIQVVGIPWPTRNTLATNDKHLYKSATQITEYIAQAVTTIIREAAAKLDAAIPAILVGHLTVSNGIFSGSEKRAIYGTDPLFLPSQLALAPFDYVALGHLHRHQNLNPGGYPAVVYSGSIERIDFGERKEQKGFCLVTIAEKNKTSYEFIEVPIRPFLQLDVVIKADQPQTEQILALIAQHDIHDAIVKIRYFLPPGKSDNVNLKKVQLACENAMYLVGIIPVHTAPVREQRSALKVTMDLQTLLSLYFEAKPELQAVKNELIDTALVLAEEVATRELKEVQE